MYRKLVSKLSANEIMKWTTKYSKLAPKPFNFSFETYYSTHNLLIVCSRTKQTNKQKLVRSALRNVGKILKENLPPGGSVQGGNFSAIETTTSSHAFPIYIL